MELFPVNLSVNLWAGTDKPRPRKTGQKICKERRQGTKYTPKQQAQDEVLDTSPESLAPNQSTIIGRGRSLLIRNRTSISPEKTTGCFYNQISSPKLGPLTINADDMSDSDIDQAIKDVQYSGHELHITGKNGKVTCRQPTWQLKNKRLS